MATYFIEEKETIELLKQAVNSKGVVTELKEINDELSEIFEDFLFFNACTAPSVCDEKAMMMEVSNRKLSLFNGKSSFNHFYEYEIEYSGNRIRQSNERHKSISDSFRFYASFREDDTDGEMMYILDVMRIPQYSRNDYPEVKPSGEVSFGNIKVKFKTAEAALYNLFLSVYGTIGISWEEIRKDINLRETIIYHYVRLARNRGEKYIEEALSPPNITNRRSCARIKEQEILKDF